MVKIRLRDGNFVGDKRFAELEGAVRCTEDPMTPKYPLTLKVDIPKHNSQFYIGFDKFEVKILQKHFNKEFEKIKEERDDFLKLLQMENAKGLRLAKRIKSKKCRRLSDFAEKLGLIEKNGEDIVQRKEKDENVTIEWNELELWIDKPKVKNIHLHISKKELLKKGGGIKQ